VAATLRQDGVAPHHLAALHLGAKTIPRERRRARHRSDRLSAFLDAIREAGPAGLKEHDRLMLAKSRIERRLTKRRASSKLPGLVDLVLVRPIVSTGMIQDRLKISRQGALNLVGELGLREMTGRGRFRAVTGAAGVCRMNGNGLILGFQPYPSKRLPFCRPKGGRPAVL
jgi:hypothetical protein